MTQENSIKECSTNGKTPETDSNQTLGAYLQQQRLNKEQSIEEVAKATRIPPETVHALESGDKSLLPVSVFTKGFVKIYAAHLGLSQADVLERFSSEWGSVTNTTSTEILNGESMAESSPFFLSVRFFFLLFLVTLVISLAYFFFQADDTPQPVALTSIPNISPQPAPQLVFKQKEVKQLEIPTTPSQEILLISPKSAGNITMEDGEQSPYTPPEQPAADQVASLNVSQPTQVTADTQTVAKNSASANLSHSATPPAITGTEVDKSHKTFFGPINLHIRFVKRTRISIAQDNDHPEKYIFDSGEESTWQAASNITLNVDTPDAVELTLNGSPVTVDNSHDGPLAITLPSDLIR